MNKTVKKTSSSYLQMLETSPEVKAFIYQQLHEFEPYLAPQAKAGVVIQKVVKENKKIKAENDLFRVTLTLETGDGALQATGEHDNVFDATAKAKTALMSQISTIQNVTISTAERGQELLQAFHRRYLH